MITPKYSILSKKVSDNESLCWVLPGAVESCVGRWDRRQHWPTFILHKLCTRQTLCQLQDSNRGGGLCTEAELEWGKDQKIERPSK